PRVSIGPPPGIPRSVPPPMMAAGPNSGAPPDNAENGTVIMDHNPGLVQQQQANHPYGYGHRVQMQTPQTPQAFGQATPFGGSPLPIPPPEPVLAVNNANNANDMLFLAGPARPTPSSQGGGRVLVFVAVVAISFVIVIVTGLLILAAAD